KGRYTTAKEHLCSHHRYYKERSPAYYMQRGYRHSETLYTYMEALFKQDKYPEQLYKTCDGILNVAKKTSIETFDKACQMALEHQCSTYRLLKQVLENRIFSYVEAAAASPHPGHGNTRGAHTYKD